MDEQTVLILIPKLNALRAFLVTVATSGEHLPDNETRRNYREMYKDIASTVNDPNLELYAPVLPHLGTFMGEVRLQGDHQARIVDSGMRLLTYLESQIRNQFPGRYKFVEDLATEPPKNGPPLINIGNFQGILGNVENSSLSQNLHMSVTKGDFESLQNSLSELRLSMVDISELKTALEAEPTPPEKGRFGPRVATWIGNMVQKAASGAWEIGLSAAGNILAMLIAKYYGLY